MRVTANFQQKNLFDVYISSHNSNWHDTIQWPIVLKMRERSRDRGAHTRLVTYWRLNQGASRIKPLCYGTSDIGRDS